MSLTHSHFFLGHINKSGFYTGVAQYGYCHALYSSKHDNPFQPSLTIQTVQKPIKLNFCVGIQIDFS